LRHRLYRRLGLRNWSKGRCKLGLRPELDDRRTVGWSRAQTAPHRLYQRRRQTGRQRGHIEYLIDRDSSACGERLDQRRAETPYIACSGRCVILTGGPNRIAGEFQLLADGHEIRRLQLAVHQLAPVQKGQGLQGRRQQFLDFLGAQSPVAQDLCEGLVCIFHHDEEIVLPLGLPTADLEQLDQVRMGQIDRRLPLHQQGLGLRSIRPHELDRGLGQVLCLMFGKEDRPLVRPAQATAQDKTPLDDLVLPARPGVGIGWLSGFRAHLCCIRCPRRLDSSRPPGARGYGIRPWQGAPCRST